VSPTFRISTEIRKVQNTWLDFFGDATTIHARKRPPELSAVWAYTPEETSMDEWYNEFGYDDRGNSAKNVFQVHGVEDDRQSRQEFCNHGKEELSRHRH
jgi:hypothetical protein